MESLKKRVENNPLVEKIKETILQNKSSTNWQLHLDVASIQKEYDDLISQVKKEIEQTEQAKITNDGRAGTFAFKQN